MMQRPKNLSELEQAAQQIAELIEARNEWFYAEGAGRPSTLRRNECDVSVLHGRLIFSCWTDAGARSWRITGWEWTGEKLLLEATRRMGAESSMLELIPRASASMSVQLINATRRERCAYLARLVCAQWPGAKVERAGLSAGARRGQPGRYARIMLRRRAERIAVIGPIVEGEAHERDAFLSSALLWFMRAREQARGPIVGQLWLIVGPELVEGTARQLALLRSDVREAIRLFELDEQWQTITPVSVPEREELWIEQPRRLRPFRAETEMSGWAKRILSLSPEAIDVVRARSGETLRFHGLAFARVRRTVNN
ncbi:MAG: hypothetical protein ICV68_13485, partial [Pyrinomonadaceae bacterium]|nr:hypothetical protein [Pyrinomonadaceae bacterium]